MTVFVFLILLTLLIVAAHVYRGERIPLWPAVAVMALAELIKNWPF